MKITICGSIAFIDEMHQLKSQLEALGHEVKVPPDTVVGNDGKPAFAKEMYLHKKSEGEKSEEFWANHTERIRSHFEKVAWADAVLIANYDKNGIAGYIGPNTLMEMGLAFYLKEPIYLLNPIPEIPSKEEIRGMQSIVINGDLSLIK